MRKHIHDFFHFEAHPQTPLFYFIRCSALRTHSRMCWHAVCDRNPTPDNFPTQPPPSYTNTHTSSTSSLQFTRPWSDSRCVFFSESPSVALRSVCSIPLMAYGWRGFRLKKTIPPVLLRSSSALFQSLAAVCKFRILSVVSDRNGWDFECIFSYSVDEFICRFYSRVEFVLIPSHNKIVPQSSHCSAQHCSM